MSISKILFVTAATFGLTTAACAQDAQYETKTEVLDTMAVDSFTASDANADGALDRTEYETFLSAKSAEGDADATALVEAGDYDVSFMAKDVNADGLLDAAEITPQPVEETPVMEKKLDEPEMESYTDMPDGE